MISKISSVSFTIGSFSNFIDIRLPAQPSLLNDNVATLMAIANDIGFEEVFRFQLRNNLEEGDLIVAISGSGNSKNVIN